MFGHWLISQDGNIGSKLGFNMLDYGVIAWLNLELDQMDVKTAFFNGELEEVVYVE